MTPIDRESRIDRTKFAAFCAHSFERVSAGKSQFGRYGSCQIQKTKQMPQTSTVPITAAKTMRVSLCTLESLEMSFRDVLDVEYWSSFNRCQLFRCLHHRCVGRRRPANECLQQLICPSRVPQVPWAGGLPELPSQPYHGGRLETVATRSAAIARSKVAKPFT